MSSSPASALARLFDAERTVLDLRNELSSPEHPDEMLDAIASAISTAKKEPSEMERLLRLSSLAGILGRMTGPRAVDLLIDILDSPDPEARLIAGTALEDLGFERFKEVALGVERALARLSQNSPALGELPFILLENPEPGVLKLLHRFLEHQDAETVASAIEACVELGDPKSIPHLRRLEKDKRTVDFEEEPGNVTITIGELAQEARSLFEEAQSS